MTWLHKISQSVVSLDMRDYSNNVLHYFMDLSDRCVARGDHEYTYDDAKESAQRVEKQTLENMNRISGVVRNAVSNIENWNLSPVVVRVGDAYKPSWRAEPEYGDPVTHASIIVGGKNEYGSVLDFTLFFDPELNKWEIDDVLESGEEDFFTQSNTAAQQDYFRLINELRNPGQNKQSRLITLYTARPSKDRAIYENTNQVPSSIFLTNNYGAAKDWGYDLPGEGDRDIWRIKIDSKYVVETENRGHIKEYQTVGAGFVPVAYTKLVDPNIKGKENVY